ncbi:MAG: hypothetical protein RIC89_10685 [Pseudomonadales bacterium]
MIRQNDKLQLRPTLWVLTLVCCLSGCANKATPGYFLDWIPPQDAAGQACVAECSAKKWQCDVRVADKAGHCALEQEAAYDECAYQDDLRFESCVVDLQIKFPANWEDLATACDTGPANCAVPSCGSSANCDTGYEHCFLDCGGDVIERGTAVDLLTYGPED